MANYFEDFDFTGFWDDSEYALESYVEEPPTDELIQSIEQESGGYKLPAPYIQLMKMHNGGTPVKTCFPTDETDDYVEYISITGIMGIGRTNFMKEE